MLFALWIQQALRADEARTVTLTKNRETVDIKIDGKAYCTYQFGKSWPKPFLFPVRIPDGPVISRRVVTQEEYKKDRRKYDHPHHKGIWVAVDKVNGIDYWAEDGDIVNESVELVAPTGDPAEMLVTNNWVDEQKNPVVVEKTLIRIFGNGLLTYKITFHAGQKDVTFGDTKEGLFAFRMVDSMRENEGGHIVNSAGKTGSKACWGQPANWIDYYGTVKGKTCGIAIFDNPGNFKPSRYHVRNYGLFTISPFGQKAYTQGKMQAKPYTIKAGENLTLNYAMYLHSGDTKQAHVAEMYKKYLSLK